ncbi:acetate/propionate family kinase [Actinophytocola gossypii]|uniref:Acetate kinase n=1 Tax=Actinophytocola gossypii TaxID=2812003 RepID=A0ABT2J9Q2_9PSEU|nr:acetate/propionate family kinase [Actinophytocola gossypii]MCT2584592.1 acetate/propionate family kinase [Actinophytocola gossypii]
MHVLVVNAGSSSLKVRLLDPADEVVDSLDLGEWAGSDETEELERFGSALERVDAVGHRIVHGGADFTGAVLVAGDVRDRIAALAELAPLHQPRGVAGIDAVAEMLPEVPAVACFDTAFHHDLPAAAATYALPREWRRRWGLRRYGFHGLSHAHAARRAGEILRRTDLRVVSCHLGAGASLAAVHDGRSVDTTMGFTPLEGLVMATRSGSVDPGLVLWLLRHGGVDAETLGDVLEHRSGLAGLTGGSGDLREVVGDDDPDAVLAFDVYLHRLRREIAAMAAAMNGLDALVFTGGVGEHQPPVRAATAEGLAFLGVRLDADANRHATGDTDVSARDAEVRTLVITAREDVEIARLTRATLHR